jgi:hypothetical protein
LKRYALRSRSKSILKYDFAIGDSWTGIGGLEVTMVGLEVLTSYNRDGYAAPAQERMCIEARTWCCGSTSEGRYLRCPHV